MGGSEEDSQFLQIVLVDSTLLLIILRPRLALDHIQPDVEALRVHDLLDERLLVLEQLELRQVAGEGGARLAGRGLVAAAGLLVGGGDGGLLGDDVEDQPLELGGKASSVFVGTAARGH